MKLHRKLILFITIILVTVLSIYSYYSIETMKQQVIGQMKSSAILLAKSLERGIVTSGALQNKDMMQRLVIDFNKVDGIEQVYVVDRHYTIIAHQESKKIGQIYDNKDVRDAIMTGKATTEFKKEDGLDLYDVVIPVTDNGRTAGAIEVELDLKNFNGMIYAATVKAIFSIILTIVILALVLNILLFKVVIKRLKDLVGATNEIAAGHFNTLTVTESRDEIGQLTNSFNSMIVSLEKLSERDKSANPLTGLPGNIIIKEELDQRLENHEEFSVLYIDLDNFKAYNDRFGFEIGDEMIKYTSSKIQQAVKERGNPNDFVGHIGGDDFVVITSLNEGEQLANRITVLFEADIDKTYGGSKQMRTSVSVAHIKVPKGEIANSLKLGEMAAELKKMVKKLPGSNYLTK